LTSLPVVTDSIAGTEIDTQFFDAAVNGLAVSEQTGAGNTNRPAILPKWGRTALAIEENLELDHLCKQ